MSRGRYTSNNKNNDDNDNKNNNSSNNNTTAMSEPNYSLGDNPGSLLQPPDSDDDLEPEVGFSPSSSSLPSHFYPSTADWPEPPSPSTGYRYAYGAGGAPLTATSGLPIYLWPALIVVGTVGNAVAAGVLRRQYPAVQLSTVVYLLAALAADTVLLWCRAGAEWLRLAADRDLRVASGVLCKAQPFLAAVSLQTAAWMTVAAAAETAWVYQRPARLMTVCHRPGRARAVAAVITAVAVVVNLPSFWTFSLQPTIGGAAAHGLPAAAAAATATTSRYACVNWLTDFRSTPSPYELAARDDVDDDVTATSTSTRLMRVVASSVDLVITDLAPYFIVFSCTVIMLTKRCRRRDQLRQLDNTWKACHLDSTGARQLQAGFAAVGLLHTVLLFPRLALRTLLFLVDPRLTGLVVHTVALGAPAPLVNVAAWTLAYVIAAGKFAVFALVSGAFRRKCVVAGAASPCAACCCRRCCCCCGDQFDRDLHRHPGGSGDDDDVICAADRVATDQPLLLPFAGGGRSECGGCGGGGGDVGENHVLQEPMSTSDVNLSSPVANGSAPCVKIFSMTSV